MKRIAILLMLALSLAIPTAASAAKPDTASYTTTDPNPSFGDTVTFTAQSSADVWLFRIECFQNDSLVLWAGDKINGESPRTQVVTFDTPAWVDGGADCVAKVVSYDSRPRTLKDVFEFTVSP